jgi:uncharacterized RDD family membrane protein YckC
MVMIVVVPYEMLNHLEDSGADWSHSKFLLIGKLMLLLFLYFYFFVSPITNMAEKSGKRCFDFYANGMAIEQTDE